jgi:hypothetical protein
MDRRTQAHARAYQGGHAQVGADRARGPVPQRGWRIPPASDDCPALVLNADYTPLSYYPLSLWPWQTAIKAVFLERVDIVAAMTARSIRPRST